MNKIVDRPEECLNALLEKGRKNGLLTMQDLEQVSALGLDEASVEQFYDRLEKEGVIVECVLPSSDAELLPEEGDLDALEEVSPEELAETDELMADTPTDDPVRMYLREIGNIPLLTADEETELAERMTQGDEKAKRRLTEANLRLVV